MAKKAGVWVEIDIQDALDNLTRNEKQDFINENLFRASTENLMDEIQKRGLKIERMRIIKN